MAQSDYDNLSGRYFGVGYLVWNEYHAAIKEWLSGIQKRRGGKTLGEINVVYSTPELAFARDVSKPNQDMPDIPLITYYLSSVSPARDRQQIPNFPDLYFTKEKVGDEWQRAPKSIPYDLSYSITLWHKYEYEAQYVDWDILSRFSNNYSGIIANGAFAAVHIESISDSSDLEPGSANDRKLRRTYSIKVDGWLPLPYTQVGSLQTVDTTLTDVTVPEEDLNNLINNADASFEDENLQELHDTLWATNPDSEPKEITSKNRRIEGSPDVDISFLRNDPAPTNLYAKILSEAKIILGGKMKL